METYQTYQKGQVANIPDRTEYVFPRRADGRVNARKSLGSDKVLSIAGSAISNGSINAALINYAIATVTVSAGNSTGTTSVVSGGIIVGYYPSTNQDQFIKSAVISGTTLTVTLLANATASNVFKFFILAP